MEFILKYHYCIIGLTNLKSIGMNWEGKIISQVQTDDISEEILNINLTTVESLFTKDAFEVLKLVPVSKYTSEFGW